MSGMSPASTQKTTNVRASAIEGRGLFATRSLEPGELVGEYHLLMLSAAETQQIKKTVIHHYVFDAGIDSNGEQLTALALGEISFCNHSTSANADFKLDKEAKTVCLIARHMIKRDDEILIDYEDYADEIL